MLVGGHDDLVAVAGDEAANGVCLGWLGLAGVGDAVWLKGRREKM